MLSYLKKKKTEQELYRGVLNKESLADTTSSVYDGSITSAPGKSQDKNSYALSEAEDSEYMELAKKPEKNEERLNELVSKAARKAFVRAVADGDIFDLVENASYTASAKDTKGYKK